MSRASRLGRLMRERREEHGLTLRDLARVLDAAPSHISDVETGRRVPSEALLSRILDALDVTDEVGRDVWTAAAGVLPDELVTALLARPERWVVLRELLAEWGRRP